MLVSADIKPTMPTAGQETATWKNFWSGLTPESEIRMWDFYGLRHWILKYVPRHGKTLEAGCGLGRYVFYLSHLGINIEGLDFQRETIELLNAWQRDCGYECNFLVGDVARLQYPSDSLSGYISLGVVEHFIEGPQLPLQEAFRALRPGGIAIITTPAASFAIHIQRTVRFFKRIAKKVLNRKISPELFFQYWYTPKVLAQFVEGAGFHVSRAGAAELLYAFFELSEFRSERILGDSMSVRIANAFENSFLSRYGSQSIVIGVKTADRMHCFLCGELGAIPPSLEHFDVPICEGCMRNPLSRYYVTGAVPAYNLPYRISPKIEKPQTLQCEFCKRAYVSDRVFERFGFAKNACNDCLRRKEINIVLSNEHVQPIWRDRNSSKRNEC
jgi:SAM-dependent methyltransferase